MCFLGVYLTVLFGVCIQRGCLGCVVNGDILCVYLTLAFGSVFHGGLWVCMKGWCFGCVFNSGYSGVY